MQRNRIDLVWSALADPTRRGMLERLAEGETNITTLAAPFAMSQPAVSKHLTVLERAGLIQRTRKGREHHIRVDPRPLAEAGTWIEHYARLWQEQFDAVDAYLKARSGKASNRKAPTRKTSNRKTSTRKRTSSSKRTRERKPR